MHYPALSGLLPWLWSMDVRKTTASLSGGDSSRRDELIEDTKEEWCGSGLHFWKSGSAFELAPCADVPSVMCQSYLGCP